MYKIYSLTCFLSLKDLNLNFGRNRKKTGVNPVEETFIRGFENLKSAFCLVILRNHQSYHRFAYSDQNTLTYCLINILNKFDFYPLF